MLVSSLILTKNEEINLPGCLDSLSWCDDIVIFDSFSTDNTVEIARSRGARVFQRKFVNYGAQREAARTLVEYKHPWVLALDADERPTTELVSEIDRILKTGASQHVAYRIRHKDFFMGRWIKHSSLYPSWFIRLYMNDKISYPARGVHEYPKVQGSLGELQAHVLHYSFNKGLAEWIAKHNRYSSMEAAEAIAELENCPLDWQRLAQFDDPVIRRRFLKSLSYRLPFRPALRFAYMYVFRRGFLDGVPGLTYCTLLSFYEYLIVLKMKEIRARNEGREL